MNQNQITIAVDAMGGDNSPEKTIKGCEIFLNNNLNVKLIIFGNKNSINNLFLKKYSEIVNFVHCEEIILNDDKPSSIEVFNASSPSASKSLITKSSIFKRKNGALGGINESRSLEARLFTPLAPIPWKGVEYFVVPVAPLGGIKVGKVNFALSLALSRKVSLKLSHCWYRPWAVPKLL